ncbi:diguanylate cyclase [Reinekea marina]|uniref:Diguanylate cyclase n=1 Tax=Reinekea marina TaxID=1310421 RepID=A0ABV7WSD1_9GAMM|nr:diguanylate cyclase [Reinekea marina]MDN3647704.1 diguanylate cyclase [Reinekea marina]
MEAQVQIEQWLSACWDIMISEPAKAITLANQVIDNSEPQSEFRSSGLYYRGLSYMYQGDFNRAFDELTDALHHAHEHHFDLNTSRINNALGMVHQSNGRYGPALDHFELTSEFARESGNTPALVPPLSNMAQVFFDMGDLESASDQLREIDELNTKISDDNLVEIDLLRARIQLGYLNFQEAEAYLAKAIALAHSINYASFKLRCQEVLGRLRRLQGRLDEAESIFKALIEDSDIYSVGSDAIYIYIELSKLLISKGQIDDAIEIVEDGITFVKPLKRSPQNIKALGQLAYAYEMAEDTHNHAKALSLLVSAMKHSSKRQGQSFLDVRRIKRQQVKDQFQKKLLDQENQALKRAQNRLEFLNDIAHQLASTLNFVELGQRLFDIFSRKVDTHFLSLVTTDYELQSLKFQFVIDQNELVESENIPFNTPGSNMVKAALTRKVVVINDARKEKVVNLIGNHAVSPRTMLFFPLVQENEVIGVFSIQSPIPSAFSEEEIHLLEAVTTFISIAVSNIQSHETVKQLNKILHQEKQEIETAQQRIEHMAYHDSLTSLPNRESLDIFINGQIEKARFERRNFHLVYIDLDGFKPVNDQFGHRVGDQVLIVISRRIQKALRSLDFAARVGGDEFVLIIDSFDKKGAVKGFLERLLGVIQEPISVDQHNLTVSASIGAARFPEQGSDLDRLMHSADQAMYAIKRLGTGGFQFVENHQ